MGKVIGVGRFPKSGKRKGSTIDEQVILDIDQGVYGDNVVLFTPKENEESEDAGIDFREKIVALVETIINLGVQDYMSSIPPNIPSGNPFSQVADVYGKMFDEALVVVETLDYVDKIYAQDFDEEFKIQTLGEILYRYRKGVFSLLKRNEKRKGS